MKTDGTPLHGSYFDLASAKHPDLQSARDVERGAGRSKARPKKRRRRFGALPAVLCGALVGVVWLVVALRPEEKVRSATAARSATAVATPLEPAPPGRRDAGAPSEPAAVVPATPESTKPEPAAIEPAATEPAAVEPPATEPAAVEPPATEPAAVEPPATESAAVEPAVTEVAPSPAEALATAPPATLEAAVPASEPAAPPPLIPARKISVVAPVYPEVARQAGEEGTVVVEAVVDATGAVAGTAVVRGRSPELDAAARAALEKWRFEPARRGGVTVESSVRVRIKFALEEASSTAPTAATVPVAPIEVAGEVEPPRRLEAPLPAYPDAAWAAGVTGDVLVRAVIDTSGAVADVEVLRGQPYGMTEAAVDAIRRWKFAPATRHGQPVAVYRNLSVSFEG